METLTHTELKDLILNDNSKGVKFISLKTKTIQNSLNKGGRGAVPAMFESISINPDTITKYTQIVGLLSGSGVTYQDFVNNRLNKEAKDAQLSFEAGVRKWGQKLEGSNALVEHKGKYYLVLYCMANNKPIVEHRYNGKLIDLNDSKFDTWRKPEKNEGSKDAGSG